jgi:hypothetical protein
VVLKIVELALRVERRFYPQVLVFDRLIIFPVGMCLVRLWCHFGTMDKGFFHARHRAAGKRKKRLDRMRCKAPSFQPVLFTS